MTANATRAVIRKTPKSNDSSKVEEAVIQVSKVLKVRGDMSSRRGIVEIIGPCKVYLPTGRTGPDGKLIMVDIQDEETEEFETKPEMEEEPFLQKVYFKKLKATPSLERARQELRESSQNMSGQLAGTIKYLSIFLHSWDLTNGGIPVPPTYEGMIEADVDEDIIYGCLNTYWESRRPPKTAPAQ